MLLQKIVNLEKDSVMREPYDKRSNILVHGLNERENETKRQNKKSLKTFLRNGLELDPDATKLVDAHRLFQRTSTKAGKMKNRPTIFKVSKVFDKDFIYENISKLKDYNNDRTSTVFITEHFPKLFYKKKQLLMQQFKDAKEDKKDVRLGAYNSQYYALI